MNFFWMKFSWKYVHLCTYPLNIDSLLIDIPGEHGRHETDRQYLTAIVFLRMILRSHYQTLRLEFDRKSNLRI